MEVISLIDFGSMFKKKGALETFKKLDRSKEILMGNGTDQWD